MTLPGVAALKAFARRREVCELCSAEVASEHDHALVVEGDARRLLCCCAACAEIRSGARTGPRRVVRRARRVEGDLEAALELAPIRLFFLRVRDSGEGLASYPSAAGLIDSPVAPDAWDSLAKRLPVLRELEPEVEALLVDGTTELTQGYRVSIDHCFELTGLLRQRWRGISGGKEAWSAVRSFFARLVIAQAQGAPCPT